MPLQRIKQNSGISRTQEETSCTAWSLYLCYHIYSRPVGWGGGRRSNMLTTSIQSPCVAITARVDATSLSSPAVWLELKKTVYVALHGPYYKEGGKAQAHTNHLSLI